MSEDREELNKIKIPLPDVRMFIVDLLRDGHTEYPLGDFLYELREIYRSKKEDNA